MSAKPRLLTLVLLCLAFAATTSRASAYPWMIRHGYTACATCHTDPSGAGLLTEYGRAQSALLLSSYAQPLSDDDQHRTTNDFLFGMVSEPSWLLLQGWVRNGYIWNDSGGKLVDRRFLQMRADFSAHVALGAFRAEASLGYNDRDAATQAEGAWLTKTSSSGNLVSREHWIGFALVDEAILVRAGRINLPFGLRIIEHTSWVRSETRTDINQSQQHGVALAYTHDWLRAEAMLIAGNYQVSPDAYRERGYSGYAEAVLAPTYTLGVSSLIAHAASDIITQRSTTRQVHGVFARASPIMPLVLLGEVDALVTTASGAGTHAGYVGFLQADVEPIRGVHAVATGEALNRGGSGEVRHFGTWLGAAWYPVPHLDARVDAIRRTAAAAPTELTILAQLQLYL